MTPAMALREGAQVEPRPQEDRQPGAPGVINSSRGSSYFSSKPHQHSSSQRLQLPLLAVDFFPGTRYRGPLWWGLAGGLCVEGCVWTLPGLRHLLYYYPGTTTTTTAAVANNKPLLPSAATTPGATSSGRLVLLLLCRYAVLLTPLPVLSSSTTLLACCRRLVRTLTSSRTGPNVPLGAWSRTQA